MPRPKNIKQIVHSSDGYFEVNRILKEKRDKGVTKYLLEWKGIDPSTGKAWKPTWEPASHVTPDVISAWENEESLTSTNGKKRKRDDLLPSSPVQISSPSTAGQRKQNRPAKRLRRGRDSETPVPLRPEFSSLQLSPVAPRPRFRIHDPDDEDSNVQETTTSASKVESSTASAASTSAGNSQLEVPTGLPDLAGISPAESSQEFATQVSSSALLNITEEPIVVIPADQPLTFINPVHLARQVIPDSQSFNETTTSESQKQNTASEQEENSLPQPQPDRVDSPVPLSSFVPQTDPVEEPYGTADYLVQEALPATQPAEPSPRVFVQARPQADEIGSRANADSFELFFTFDPLPSVNPSQPLAQRHIESAIRSTQDSSRKTQSREDGHRSGHSVVAVGVLPPVSTLSAHQQERSTPEHRPSDNQEPRASKAEPPFTSEEQEGITRRGAEARTHLDKSISTEEPAEDLPFDSQETVSQVTPQKGAERGSAPHEASRSAAIRQPSKPTALNEQSVLASPPPIVDTLKGLPSVSTSQAERVPGDSSVLPSETSIDHSNASTVSKNHVARGDLAGQSTVPGLARSAITARKSQKRVPGQVDNQLNSPKIAINAVARSRAARGAMSESAQTENAGRANSSAPMDDTNRPGPNQAATAIQSISTTSDIQPPSSIPPAPSQLPETLLSQTLPPRPATPSSVASVPSQSYTPKHVPTDAEWKRMSFGERRAIEKANNAAKWEAIRAARETGDTARLSMLLNGTQPAATQTAAEIVPIAPKENQPSNSAIVDGTETNETRLKPADVGLIDEPMKPGVTAIQSNELDVSKTTNPQEVQIFSGPQLQAATSSAQPLELAVAVTLPGPVQRLYSSIFDKARLAIQAFVDADDGMASPAIREKVDEVIEQANDACFHPDAIGAGPLTQLDFDNDIVTRRDWDNQQSRKLAIFTALFNTAKHLEKHIVIFGKAGRTMDILQRFIDSCQISYARPEQHQDVKHGSSLSVTMLTSDAQQVVTRADLVIGIDYTFDAKSPQVEIVRKQLNGSLCPAVTLVTPYTVEHISRVLQAGSDDSRLRDLLTQATHLRKRVGTFTQPSHIGQQLAQLLLGDVKAPSALPLLPDLAQPATSLAQQILGPFFSCPTAQTIMGTSRVREDLLHAMRRAFDSDPATRDDMDALRKHLGIVGQQLLDLTADRATPQQAETSRKRNLEDITTSTADPAIKKARFEEASINADLDGSLNSTTHITDTTAQVATQSQPNSLPNSIPNHYQAQLASLRTELQATRAAAAAQDTILSTLTDDHRTHSHTLHTLNLQLKRAQSALTTSETKRTDLLTTLSTVRADLSTTRADLATAHAALASSTVPALATYGATQQRAAQADILDRKLASLQKDFDFTRQQYQAASDSAATLASDLSAAQTEIQRLTHAASEQRVTLRGMYADNAVKVGQEEVEKAKAERDAMERLVRRLERENAELKEKEGRRGMAGATRASSLPAKELGVALAGLAHGGAHGRSMTPNVGAAAGNGAGLGVGSTGANALTALGGRVSRADGTASALARSAAVGSRNASPRRAVSPRRAASPKRAGTSAAASRTASPRRGAAASNAGLGLAVPSTSMGSRAGSRQPSPARRAASPGKRR